MGGAKNSFSAVVCFSTNAEALINKMVQHFFVNAAPFILLFPLSFFTSSDRSGSRRG